MGGERGGAKGPFSLAEEGEREEEKREEGERRKGSSIYENRYFLFSFSLTRFGGGSEEKMKIFSSVRICVPLNHCVWPVRKCKWQLAGHARL